MGSTRPGRLGAAGVAAAALLWGGGACAEVVTLDITAYTDGRDYLVIQGDQLYWHHLDYAAPGRLGGVDLPTIVKTSLDGAPVEEISWTPTWPLPPPDEIRFPADSSKLTWAPGAPTSGVVTASLDVIQARYSLSLLQQPTASNDYTTILDFNDDPPGGAAYYEGVLTLSTGPLPPPIPAVATLSSNTVNFGTVRGGTPNVNGKVAVTNTATGFPVDNLNVVSATGLPANVSLNGALPVGLGSGASGDIGFLLDTTQPGVVGGSATLGFTSTSAAESLTLANQQVSFSGTVTQIAKAALVLDSGAGVLTGGGNSYQLNLGPLEANSGSVTSDIGVLNDIADTVYAETLGGAFGGKLISGYTFDGAPFSGLVGGATDVGNLLTFDTTGLRNGNYDFTIELSPTSSYPGLSDLGLHPIRLMVSASIFGSSAVPEPSTWAMMLVGCGALGAVMRSRTRRRLSAA